jgi:hypothetical protein
VGLASFCVASVASVGGPPSSPALEDEKQPANGAEAQATKPAMIQGNGLLSMGLKQKKGHYHIRRGGTGTGDATATSS